MLWCKRSTCREQKLMDVVDVVVVPVKSQYGIVGYIAEIHFKGTIPKIQVYQKKGETVQQEFEELS